MNRTPTTINVNVTLHNPGTNPYITPLSAVPGRIRPANKHCM